MIARIFMFTILVVGCKQITNDDSLDREKIVDGEQTISPVMVKIDTSTFQYYWNNFRMELAENNLEKLAKRIRFPLRGIRSYGIIGNMDKDQFIEHGGFIDDENIIKAIVNSGVKDFSRLNNIERFGESLENVHLLTVKHNYQIDVEESFDKIWLLYFGKIDDRYLLIEIMEAE